MSSISSNKILLKDQAGFFVGNLSDNRVHQHYALQCTVSLKESVAVYDQDHSSLLSTGAIIKSLTGHRLVCQQPVLIVLLNPASKAAHFFHHHYSPKTIDHLPDELTTALQSLGQQWFSNQLLTAQFLDEYTVLIQQFIQACTTASHRYDPRIADALDYLEANSDKVISLTEVAQYVFLSSERFRHLFRTETGITFRRLQLWNKLVQVFQAYSPSQSFTQLAYEHGFSDSAHLSRTFKETFGLSPSQLFNNSRFIQD